MLARVYHPNGPSEDPRPWSEIRAGRGIEAIEDAIDGAMVQIEAAIDAVAVQIDNYDTCYEDDRKRAVAACREALGDMAFAALDRLERSR